MTFKEKILSLVPILQDMGVIRFEKEFREAIGISYPRYSMIKYNTRAFPEESIVKMLNIYNVNANWLFGVEENIFRDQKKPMPKLSDAPDQSPHKAKHAGN